MNKHNNKMKQQQTFDLGPTLADISAEKASNNNLILFTAYVNGTSLRSHNLHLDAVRDRFLQGVWLLSGAEEDKRVTDCMDTWIRDRVEGGMP
jgi:hypothetical protein